MYVERWVDGWIDHSNIAFNPNPVIIEYKQTPIEF
jgi:hypothetical protein